MRNARLVLGAPAELEHALAAKAREAKARDLLAPVTTRREQPCI
jgi:hypothetical protein